MKKIKFWERVRHERYDEWRLAECADESDVPEMCWRTFNRRFWQKREKGDLFPADELAAYHEGCFAMMEATRKLGADNACRCGKKGVKPTTYIIAAGMKRLCQFVREEVTPERNNFRRLFDQCRVNGTFDIRAWVEAMPQLHAVSPEMMREAARRIIDETLPRCSRDTRRGIRALLKADMVASDAAQALEMPLATFRYQRDTAWYPNFRRMIIHAN